MKKIKLNTFLKVVGVVVFFMSMGCSKLANLTNFTGDMKRKASCAEMVIERSFKLHEDAKYSLAIFFDERSDEKLYQAFYAASDSVRESRKVKNCWDRKRSHYYAMKNIKEMNISLARVIRRNLPDDDSGEMIAVYHNQFDWVMPHMR